MFRTDALTMTAKSSTKSSMPKNDAGNIALPDHPPFVSVVLPIRNEAAFIEENLARLLKQDYPEDRFEIIVADGLSDDGTRQIVEARSRGGRAGTYGGQSQRIVPTGMNILIEHSRGDIVLRLDGHTHVATTSFNRA